MLGGTGGLLGGESAPTVACAVADAEADADAYCWVSMMDEQARERLPAAVLSTCGSLITLFGTGIHPESSVLHTFGAAGPVCCSGEETAVAVYA